MKEQIVKQWIPRFILLVFVGLPLVFVLRTSNCAMATQREAQIDRVMEGHDFATQILRDPWDMNEFTDISQWINHVNFLNTIEVENSVFSAHTNGSVASFFVLYPGYLPGVKHDKIGARMPIDTSTYGCFYAAMKVDINNPRAHEYYNISWLSDRILKTDGFTYNTELLNSIWKIYQINLFNWQYQSGSQWADKDWKGLLISPVSGLSNPGADFEIDWVRLTDCQPVYYSIGNIPPGSYSLYLHIGSPSRKILAVEKFSPNDKGNYQFDVQGLEPGFYDYTIESGGSIYGQGELEVVSAPIVKFAKPSMYSGEEYSTESGNAWDYQDSKDVTEVQCADWNVSDSLLYVDTKPPNHQPPRCVGGGAGESDPIVYLNTQIPEDLSQYRYLTFKHNIDGAYSLPEKGMVVRWIWGVGRQDASPCYYVSREFALDIGWQVYSADLYDNWNGMPVEVGGLNCPALTHWKNQHGQIVQLRIDPNENVTSSTFHQQFDWIRLTKVDQATVGFPYKIIISLNKPVEQITNLSFYYTNDLNHPYKYTANKYLPDYDDGIGNGFESKVFLPLIFNNYSVSELPEIQNEVDYLWDTSNVSIGEYYICAKVEDGYNNETYCSEAPVQVVNP